MSGQHPVAAAVGFLHAALTADLGDEVAVDLGLLQPGTTESLDSVVVGLSPDDDTAASGEVTYEFGAAQWDFDIPGAAMSLSGDEDDALDRLARAYELVDRVDSVVDGLRSQGAGPVSWGRLSRHVAQWRTGDAAGTGAQVVFAVSCTAFREHEEL